MSCRCCRPCGCSVRIINITTPTPTPTPEPEPTPTPTPTPVLNYAMTTYYDSTFLPEFFIIDGERHVIINDYSDPENQGYFLREVAGIRIVADGIINEVTFHFTSEQLPFAIEFMGNYKTPDIAFRENRPTVVINTSDYYGTTTVHLS